MALAAKALDKFSQIKLLVPDMPTIEELRPWLDRISENKWYTNFGPLCTQFESELSEIFSNADKVHITTVSSCTTGLELALGALELPKDANVLLPALTFPATASAVLRAGLTPVFCDVDPKHGVLTLNVARDYIEGFDCRAVVPVSLFGQALDSASWDKFAVDNNTPVIIDAAGAFGNQKIGKTTSAVFSLHATKPLAVGEGGFVASSDSEYINQIRVRSNFGFDNGLVGKLGTNSKFSEYQAAVGLAALRRWSRSRMRRTQLASIYIKSLRGLSDRVNMFIDEPSTATSVFPIRVLSGITDKIIGELLERGVETRRWYYPALHKHPLFSNCPMVSKLTGTESLSNELLGLPFHLELDDESIQHISDALSEVIV